MNTDVVVAQLPLQLNQHSIHTHSQISAELLPKFEVILHVLLDMVFSKLLRKSMKSSVVLHDKHENT